jgi:hypothetical protein
VGDAREMAHYIEARIRKAIGNDRGDVPGWVMITLMTAALVAIVWGLAAGWLKNMFTQAQGTVTGPGAGGATSGG